MATSEQIQNMARALYEREREIQRLREELSTTIELLGQTIDPDECHFDHHGGCQAHSYLSLEPGELCPNARAKQLVTIYKLASPGA